MVTQLNPLSGEYSSFTFEIEPVQFHVIGTYSPTRTLSSGLGVMRFRLFCDILNSPSEISLILTLYASSIFIRQCTDGVFGIVQ